MKKKILAALLFLILISSCTKRELRTFQYPLPEHCYNDVMDANEIGTDCGGDCDDCEQKIPNCSLDSNEITIQLNGIDSSMSFIDCSVSASEYYYYFTAYTNSTDYLALKIYKPLDVTKSHNGESDSLWSSVFVKYYQSNGLHKTGDGTVYINFENNIYTISSCHYYFDDEGDNDIIEGQHFSADFEL